MQRTINLVLPLDDRIVETIRLYNVSCNLSLNAGFKRKTFNKTKIHRVTYRKIRKLYPKLNSSYVCASRDCASDMLKREKLKRLPVKNELSSIRLNHNTFTPFLKSGSISLSTINGRIKIPIRIPDYYKQYASWKISAATMGMSKNTIKLHLIADDGTTPKKLEPKNIIGIDRGIVNPVVTSDNQFFNSRKLRAIKGKYMWLRASLKRKGTRSAKRHLQRLSGRERRFVRDFNHNLSKRLVESEADTFVLEKLKLQKKKKNGRRFNRLLGTWSYGQFQQFLEYKAEALGKNVIYVDPRHTSQKCGICGNTDRANRRGPAFKCRKCGFSLNSDLNAARNIAQLGKALMGRLPINQPIVACNDAKPRNLDEHSYKPPVLTGGS